MILHIENSRTFDTLVPQLQLTTATWETEALCRLRVSSWEQAPLPEPYTGRWCRIPRRVVAGTATWVRDLLYERFSLHGDNQGVFHFLLDNVAKECRLEGQDWQNLREMSPTQCHQSNGAVEEGRLHSARSCSHTLGSHQRQKSRLSTKSRIHESCRPSDTLRG